MAGSFGDFTGGGERSYHCFGSRLQSHRGSGFVIILGTVIGESLWRNDLRTFTPVTTLVQQLRIFDAGWPSERVRNDMVDLAIIDA